MRRPLPPVCDPPDDPQLDEAAIVRIAAFLIGDSAVLSAPERALVERCGVEARTDRAQRIADGIRAGRDVLGESLLRSRGAAQRRKAGQVFTPPPLIEAMLSQALAHEGARRYARIVDPGCGSGRYLIAAAKRWPDCELVGCELDPLCALATRANAAVLGFADRLRMQVGDFRQTHLSAIPARTLFVGNPPYVRHHDLDADSKRGFVDAAAALGIARASQLAGLHIHFLIKTGLLAAPGDVGVFVTAAEWLDANYGRTLRAALLGPLGGLSVDVVDARAEPFPGTLTTGAVIAFEVGSRAAAIRMGRVCDPAGTMSLGVGPPVAKELLAVSGRWSMPRPVPAPLFGASRVVGDLFRVSRGQVTGMNAVWIFGKDTPPLPQRFLTPSVTGAEELFRAAASGEGLCNGAALKRVIELPESFEALLPAERIQVARFLRWARARGADRTYIARHRRPWWKLRLPKSPPIICTYMARRAPVFVRNRAAVSLLNIAHGLYPMRPMSEAELDGYCASLNRSVQLSDGRVYAGGLTKFEPSSVAALEV